MHTSMRCGLCSQIAACKNTAPGEVVDLVEIGATKTNRALYGLLWVLEILAIVVLILVLALPNPDYAWRQSIEWQQHPSPETYKALLEKKRQGTALRLIFALPFGVTAACPFCRLFTERILSSRTYSRNGTV